MAETYAVECTGITKYFGRVCANEDVDFTLKRGEILSVLGENGSGKTTLMNMLAGIYFPDRGRMLIDGKEEMIKSPRDAFNLRIGMIHQHFKLIDVLTAAENIVLGLSRGKKLHSLEEEKKYIRELIDTYGFDLDLDKKIYDMSVSEKQTTEIVKVLYKGADILILDEPTAVLTPQEADKLFNVLRIMKKNDKAVVLITHKLMEVLDVSDRVMVLRKGRNEGVINTSEATVEKLTEMMVGEKVELNIDRDDPVDPKKYLEVRDLVVKGSDGLISLDGVSFDAYGGEILGVAGISGSGQKEFLESVAGLTGHESGDIRFFDAAGNQSDDVKVSLAFVPEDRLGMGLVGSMDIVDNMMLRSYNEGKGPFVDRKPPRELAEKIVDKLEVVTPGLSTPVSRLSGGNVQKVLLGREISQNPQILLVAYPVRGLDINSSYAIYRLLSEEKKKGVCVICVIEDLDILMELCDRILVLSEGKVTGIEDARTVTKDRLGLLMTGGID
ncbi:MAG: ABC transporter ATP-binding protein [Eubacterium sp.]|nr:ABC transporter ATP-binding protein [Eubacterium sp.]